MKEKLRFLGLDVHAETIAVAIAEPDGEVRSVGTIPNRMESIRKLVKKLGSVDKLRACYEAGPTGYVVYWQLAELGVQCEVIAPTLMPVKAGDRVKTDRRDAEKLARCYRSGDLTRYGFRMRVPRGCAIWCVSAKQPSRIRRERAIG
jgi:transposase